ncbi:3-oxoacyl-ACP reductase [Sandaracinus amylolyticus]|uniref:3-oxoacyl-[acyl-carrier protein] reductase n=1 Tax=Sandaracinus amylolyticus TaxID=927083 RepID=A0A0F6W1T6_9BACT|nr:3-oxoacyl-ACP reductase [Sandaracinus amylolyticus]AKF05090.1 3-oxoacyl-[acyl-carrier protein] reductase [Sandaracinus amylolyticus]
MSDVLLEIAKRPAARSLVQRIGLPLPVPEPLRRADGAWREQELAGLDVVIALHGPLAGDVAQVLRGAGARVLSEAPSEGTIGALVVDATGLARVADLRSLYDALHGPIGRIARSGRVIVLGRAPESAASPEAAAAQQALEGLVRSVAKEVGRRGATANLVVIGEGAEERARGVIVFLASARSAFVTAQPFRVTRTAAPLVGEIPRARSLHGKVALVTGAARGIGAATARLLAAEGARVVLLDRPDDERETLAVARAIGGSTISADITDRDAPARIARAITDSHGGLDVVVHNAGVTRDRTLAKMSTKEWDQAVDVNLGAVVRITDALAKGPLRDGGRVILLSSIAGLAGNVGQANYAASKAGIAGLARALAPQLAPRAITVNAIAPGFIETRLTAAIPLVIREAGRRLAALGQGGQPDDVAHAITFLATPHAHGLTGQVLRVCGGALVGA